MGIFKSQEELKQKQLDIRETQGDNLYFNDVKPCLSIKDGFTHSIMLNITSGILEHNLGTDKATTGMLNAVMTLMQNDGYEIIDAKFESVNNIGINSKTRGFNVLLIYK